MKEEKLPTIEETFEWMRKLYDESYSLLTKTEKGEQHMYGTMVTTPSDKKFIVRMLDETSQVRDNKKLARRVKDLIDKYGIPKFLGPADRALFWMYQKFAFHPTMNWAAVPIIKWRLHRDTSRVIIDAARPKLTKHLADRFDQKIGQNVNLLGEVVVGSGEADKRYFSYLEALKEPDINYISVKISGIYAGTNPLNKKSFPELVRRMSELYQHAIDYPYVDKDGNKKPKFINLDMEEYKDAHLTMKLFKEVLSLPQFKNYEAGIVVQAYLPDAWGFQDELLEFARKRVAEGGSPIKMRIVKGCNLDMENIVSDLRGWPNPVLPTKTEVDANYLRVIERGLKPENAKVLHIGMASHNLFTIAYAHLLTEMYGTPKDTFCFEMLEGMANHVWRAQKKLGNHVILYTPVVKKEHFLNAISYLVRRMDENTAPDNFLTHSFSLKPDTPEWHELEQQFRNAYALKDSVSKTPTRTQDRNKPYEGQAPRDEMVNEPDTDFDREPNQLWVDKIFDKWKPQGKAATTEGGWGEWEPGYVLPTQIGGKLVFNTDKVKYFDRSQPGEVLVCEMSRADKEQTQQIIDIAHKDPSNWRHTTVEQRHKIMYKAANNLGAMRGDLIGAMCAITGKTVEEADVEVSEAIDYCRYYTTALKQLDKLKDIQFTGKGAVLVLSPWNFPCAIPCGGVVAALASGNTCILKPATVAAPVAWLLAKALWDAGVPKEALQVDITDSDATKLLTTSKGIDHIILTGGTETAQTIARQNPRMPLSAETGGKNVMILSAKGDRDHAIMNACKSAFGNAGQKCSACSILLVERSVYDNPEFMEKLKDCATSINAGGVWDAGNTVGPMITNKNEKLEKALKLEKGEEWLVEPQFVDEKKFILKPTIKIGVKPDSYTFRTELFAPLLAVTPYDTLEQAVEIINNLDYGLTSGLQSLDEEEQKYWKENIEAGNLYINRGITGAVVNRQPFGGMKLSAFGPGLKAGGPNYLNQFMIISDTPDSVTDWTVSYKEWWNKEFKKARNIQPNIRGEQNVFRYLPLKKGIVLRLFGDEKPEQIVMVQHAAKIVGTPLTVSVDPSNPMANKLEGAVVKESLDGFLKNMKNFERVRIISENVPDSVFEQAAKSDKYIALGAPLKHGRIELTNYIKEQSISNEYHRYGSQIEVPEI